MAYEIVFRLLANDYEQNVGCVLKLHLHPVASNLVLIRERLTEVILVSAFGSETIKLERVMESLYFLLSYCLRLLRAHL